MPSYNPNYNAAPKSTGSEYLNPGAKGIDPKTVADNSTNIYSEGFSQFYSELRLRQTTANIDDLSQKSLFSAGDLASYYFNKIYINGKEVPGMAVVSVTFEKELKKQKKVGYHYETVSDLGAKNKVVNVKLKMNGVDYTKYKSEIQPELKLTNFTNTKTPPIIKIENPLLEQYDITEVFLESISQSSPSVGLVDIDISFIEYKAKVVGFANIKVPTKPDTKAAIDTPKPTVEKGYGTRATPEPGF